MEAREIYHVLQSIIEPIHAHDDQIVAIAKWIEAEFEYKPQKQANCVNTEQKALCSTRIDFKKLREAYFNEHVSHKTTDGIPVVCTHPHNLFEWFKAELVEYGC